MADSWKTDGNCDECRRKNYCKKVCTAQKERRKLIALRLLRENPTYRELEKIVGGQYHNFINDNFN